MLRNYVALFAASKGIDFRDNKWLKSTSFVVNMGWIGIYRMPVTFFFLSIGHGSAVASGYL